MSISSLVECIDNNPGTYPRGDRAGASFPAFRTRRPHRHGLRACGEACASCAVPTVVTRAGIEFSAILHLRSVACVIMCGFLGQVSAHWERLPFSSDCGSARPDKYIGEKQNVDFRYRFYSPEMAFKRRRLQASPKVVGRCC